MFNIRVAKQEDYEHIRDFYYEVTDGMENSQFKPGWQKDIYPTQEFLIDSIKKGEMYIGEKDGQYLTCMVVNHMYNDGYRKVAWPTKASDGEILVIHALGVAPAFAGQGIAKKMAKSVIELGKKTHMKVIRLDVLEGNIPAQKVYERLGFNYINTIQMYYEDTGLTRYMLYEYVL